MEITLTNEITTSGSNCQTIFSEQYNIKKECRYTKRDVHLPLFKQRCRRVLEKIFFDVLFNSL